jgi:S-ribosylhomocysteine lyase LuxS involved in autoinducer biosynthesis
MSVTVELLAQHSGDKDHLAMTGGTLSPDKLVRTDGDAPLRLDYVFFPVTSFDPEQSPDSARRLFSGVHSLEHALASPEGGDLRARIAERATDAALGKRLIDMSPYVPGLLSADGKSKLAVGFRSTFVTDGEGLPLPVLTDAYAASLRQIREHFARGGAVPFATPEACGQYDMHSADAAIELIDRADASAPLRESSTATDARELYVCDLRLVKPRLPESFEQRVLDVVAGHLISQAVEQSAAVSAGNFGCSTGEYLVVANPTGLNRETLLTQAHAAITVTLSDLATYNGENPLRQAAASDAELCLDHVDRYRPEIRRAAHRPI